MKMIFYIFVAPPVVKNSVSGDAPEWLGTAVGSWTCALDVRHFGR